MDNNLTNQNKVELVVAAIGLTAAIAAPLLALAGQLIIRKLNKRDLEESIALLDEETPTAA